jgi:dihydrofolate synthase/folylpolyglutamate synthase
VDAVAWIESLSPWPQGGFGTGRMGRLLAALGDPQQRYPSIHVVGTKGKTTTARTIEAILEREGLRTGCTTSPHVTGWAERIRVDGEEAAFEQAIARIRPEAERVGATQFESLVAAALATFAEARVDVAVIEAGLGGRHDATNVLRSPVQVLTNVALEHTEVLGSTREAIAAEKLAVVQQGSTVVLAEPEWTDLAYANGAEHVVVEAEGNAALAAAAASAFLGRVVEPAEVTLPGHLEHVDGEIRDGAHTPDALRYIAPRLPPLRSCVVSILADKDVDGMLRVLAGLVDTLVATASSSERALPAAELAVRARGLFRRVEVVPDPAAAVARAHELGEPVLVTGSFYLLADLARAPQDVPWAGRRRS